MLFIDARKESRLRNSRSGTSSQSNPATFLGIPCVTVSAHSEPARDLLLPRLIGEEIDLATVDIALPETAA